VDWIEPCIGLPSTRTVLLEHTEVKKRCVIRTEVNQLHD
jgi:hypothetical protein